MRDEVRGWDLAATEPRARTDPDWTCGTRIGRGADGRFYILDHQAFRSHPGGVEQRVYNTALEDGQAVRIAIPQDPGQAGKAQRAAMARKLAGYRLRFKTATGDKVTRFSPFSAQCESGNVSVLRAGWNERLFRELENFPPGKYGHDDDADAVSEAFDALVRRRPVAFAASYAFR